MTSSDSDPLAIECRGITKSFDHRPVLKGIDFKVKLGESVVIFGPNGAGKTTLLNILATITKPLSGQFFIEGLDPNKNAEDVRRKIGIVSHNSFLYGNLTARENLDFYCRLYDVPNRKERIFEVAEKVGMVSRLNDRVGTLSRGMQQRISIARCLLHKPSIILLDEPETGLDIQATSLLWETMESNEGRKQTVIHTTHSLERGLQQCSRLAILVSGKIVYETARDGIELSDLRQTYKHYTEVLA